MAWQEYLHHRNWQMRQNRAPLWGESVVSHLASHPTRSPVSIHHQVPLTPAPKWVKKPSILCLNLQHPGPRPCQLTLNGLHVFHMLATSLCPVLPLPSLKLCRAGAQCSPNYSQSCLSVLQGSAWPGLGLGQPLRALPAFLQFLKEVTPFLPSGFCT